MNVETSLINAIITSKHLTPAIKSLTSEQFTNEDIKSIYQFILDYFKQYKGTPSATLIKERFPFFEYQEELSDVGYWVERVLDKKCKVDLTEIFLEGAEVLQEQGGFKALEYLQGKVIQVQRETKTQEDVDLTSATSIRLDKYIEKATAKGLIGIPCGLSRIDSLTSGFQNGELISVIGLPGIGKSFLATFFAKSAWEAGYKVLFITLEMGVFQVAERFDSLAAQINHDHLKRGRLTQEEYDQYRYYLTNLKPNHAPFIASKPSRCSQATVLAKIEEHKPDICFIDYSRLMVDDRGGKEYKAIGNIIVDLKQIASSEKVHIPIVVLSQVHRGFERTREELPDLHNIAENFMIGADSDLVLACHATETMKEDNEMLVGIQKHRDGRNIKLRLHWALDEGIIREKECD